MWYAYLKTVKDIKMKSAEMFNSWLDLLFNTMSGRETALNEMYTTIH